jgi:hypothetical protein
MLVSCVCCVGSGLCDELITRPEESYRMCVCLIVWDVETSTMRRPRPDLTYSDTYKRLWSSVIPYVMSSHYVRLRYITSYVVRAKYSEMRFRFPFYWFLGRTYFCRYIGVITFVFLGANCRNVDVIVLVIYSISLAGATVRIAIDSSVDVEFQLDMKATGQFISLQDSYPTRHAVHL